MKRAIVIGGTTGVGNKIAEVMTANNITVDVHGRDTFNINNMPYDSDLSQYDYFVMSAGIDPNGFTPFLNKTWEDIELTLQTNLINQIKFTHRWLTQRGNMWSKAIFVGSVHNADRIMHNHLIYGLTRYSQKAFVDSLRREINNPNVGLTLLRVGKIKTNFNKNRLGDKWTPQDDERFYSGPHITVDNIQKQIVDIINDDNHYIQEISMAAMPT
jgi:short-subunit dehydrogenase